MRLRTKPTTVDNVTPQCLASVGRRAEAEEQGITGGRVWPPSTCRMCLSHAHVATFSLCHQWPGLVPASSVCLPRGWWVQTGPGGRHPPLLLGKPPAGSCTRGGVCARSRERGSAHRGAADKAPPPPPLHPGHPGLSFTESSSQERAERPPHKGSSGTLRSVPSASQVPPSSCLQTAVSLCLPPNSLLGWSSPVLL